MVKLMNLGRMATSVLFILVLLFVYANLPERVGLLYNALGQPDYEVDKSTFFYLSLGLLMLVNLLHTIFVKAFEPIPVRSGKMFFTNELFKDNFLSWLAAFAPVMNLFFIFIVAFIGIYNNGDMALIQSYGYLAFLGQFLVFAWLAAVIPIIVISKNK